MHSVQTRLWDPQPPHKHASPLSAPRLAHVTTATPAKRITFYKSGDSQFGGVRMAIHKRSFKCFDALLDDLSQKVPLPFGVRTVTTPRGTHTIQHLEQLQDGGCYLCSDRRHAKPINMELVSKRPGIWYHHSRRPQRPESSSATPPGHLPYRQRRILLVKNTEPGMRRSIVLSRRSTRSLRAFLDEVSEVMQFHVRKLYTAEGRRIDSVQTLMTCPGVLVCVGREAFSPMLINFIKKSSEEKLPGLGNRSPGLGPRTPGNGARSPGTQGLRSPPHGAHSRASEYSEGHESKKNVNFGLETKKSIIHPRSDSSTRSAHFSLSSEKSYGNGVTAGSQARPAIMNDDIEKRVLVNKDGSLSVEMRVRFRLQNDETLQWSTQIKKSPSLTNECCPLSQAQPHYLQPGQSESCSDPDSIDPEGVDYSSQPLQCSLEGNRCPCCYQRQEQQYDLWENPAHSHKQHPVPPPHRSSHTHTMVRHTHSSSSSSSCNSRRVVRCRARMSSCGGGSGSEQSQLVQEEMCVTEQVEHSVEVEQNGDTHVEVCKVSRCCSRSEVVAVDNSLRPLSRKSVEGEIMAGEDDAERPLSAVSASSHVLQSLKEDQDDEEDDLPPSVSQCSHSNELSPTPDTQLNANPPRSISANKNHKDEERESRAASAASSCQCGSDAVDRAPSSTSKKEEEAGENEGEEIKRVVSGLSSHTARSRQSAASSVCSKCGGCKRGVTSERSNQSNRASPNQDEGSKDAASDVSTQSNKTNLTNHGRLSAVSNVLESRASRTSNPEEERAASATSHRSNRSHRSAFEKQDERSPTAMSAKSSKSDKSTREVPDVTSREEAEGENAAERAASSLSAKSGASVKSHKSNCQSVTSQTDNTAVEENESNKRAPSSLSARSNASAKSGKAERPDSVTSAKSNVSAKSHKSTCSHCAKAASPGEEAAEEATGEKETEGRAASAMSAKSNKSNKSTKAQERSLSPRSEAGEDEEVRAASQMSGRSVKSNKSTKSVKSNCAEKAVSPSSNVAEENEIKEEEAQPRPESQMSAKGKAEERATSALSVKSAASAKSQNSKAEAVDGTQEERVPSAMSGKSHTSAKSSKSQNSNHKAASPSPNADTEERVASAMSAKSKSSQRSAKSPNIVTIKTPEQADEDGSERAPSAASKQSSHHTAVGEPESRSSGQTLSPRRTRSARSCSPKAPSPSPVQQLLPEAGAGEARGPSALSVRSTASAKSSRSKCSCRAEKVKEEKEGEETKEASERAASIRSSSSKRQGRESGGTEEPVSRKSSGSVSLGLPEDQEDAESAKSSVSVHKNTESTKEEEERKSSSSHNPPAVDIPTIETPGGGDGGEPNADRAGSVVSVKSSRSHKSCCNCSVKSGQTLKSKEKLPAEAGKDVETQSVKSVSNLAAHDKRTSSAMSSTSAKLRNKSPAESANNDAVTPLRPDSAATAHSQSKTKASEPAKSDYLTPVKSHKAKSTAGSDSGSVKSSKSQRKEAPVKASSPSHNSKPCSKVDACSESTLSHSLSAADLLKETMGATRPPSQQSKGSKTQSQKSEKHPRSREEVLELTPAYLPNASPNEVVSDWLRSIPANSNMLELGDELNEDEGVPQNKKAEKEEKVEPEEEEEEKKDEENCDAAQEEEKSADLGEAVETPHTNAPLLSSDSLPRSWHSSAAVMKVLLTSSLGRCRSLPEVSPVYGRRLSTSARGLLDCLAQLQLIEPAVSHGPQKHHNQQYEDIMAILQSLWLGEPRDFEAKEAKDRAAEQVTPPRSSSGVDMSSGSGGSGKENGNQGGEQTPPKETESLHEHEAQGRAEEEEEVKGNETEAEEAKADRAEEQSEDQSTVPQSLDSPKATENPSSSDKSSTNDSSKSPTDNEREQLEDSSSGTPPTVLRAPLSKRLSQDPDPVWVLNLLKKLEKQFMNHYINAMAEFKVRWDLEDNLILDTMISELRDEVSQRIQSSIEREMRKIQSRAGKGGKSPRPPQGANLSRESTMTEKRRRMLKVMKNQSAKTADSLSDGEMTGEFSDQRSDDEYCPCDACVRKKMAARPFKTNPQAAEAPVMMEFDLLKILQLKKSPALSPATAPPPVEVKGASVVVDEEGGNLEVVQEEEEEEEETKEDIKADIVLEETIAEEDEEEEEARNEEEGGIDGEENGEEEEEECQCQCGRDEEGEGETGEEEEAEETSDNTADEEEGETGGDETGGNEGETGTGGEEEESDKGTMKEATTGEEEEEEEEGGATNEESTPVEECVERNGGSSEEEGAPPQGAAAAVCVTEGEEADAEDSDGDGKPRSADSAVDDAVEEPKKEDVPLLHQFTRTSVESQPGSLEDVDMDSPSIPVDAIEVPKVAESVSTGGGAGHRRSRSPARVKRRKPKEGDDEMENS